MRQEIFTIQSNQKIAKDTYELRLAGNTDAITTPGQFVNIKEEGFFLRRPISVCDCTEGELTLIYKVVGKGTDILSQTPTGRKLDLLTGLGNGFGIQNSGEAPLLLGGGAGVAPLYYLCRKLKEEGKNVSVLLGFNTAEEVFYEEKFRAVADSVTVTTVDGTRGTRGFVTDVMKTLSYTYFYTCGPMPMFEAIEKTAVGSGEFSFEARMGCGFGACMGCSCQTKFKEKRICKDGPVFTREEILW